MKKALTLIFMTLVMTFAANAQWTAQGTQVSQKKITAKVVDRRTSDPGKKMGLIKFTNGNTGKYALVAWKVYGDGVEVDSGESCIRPNGAEDTFDYGTNNKALKGKKVKNYTISIEVNGISDNPIRPRGFKKSQIQTGADLPVIIN